MKKINPLTAFANPAIKSQNPALNPKKVEGIKQKAKKMLARGMAGKKR